MLTGFHNSFTDRLVSKFAIVIIKPHRSTTCVDAAYCYRPSSVVSRSVTIASPVKTAEPIEMPFGCGLGWSQGTQYGADADKCTNGVHIGATLHANAIEPTVCGGDAALCQITLTTCY